MGLNTTINILPSTSAEGRSQIAGLESACLPHLFCEGRTDTLKAIAVGYAELEHVPLCSARQALLEALVELTAAGFTMSEA